VLRRTLAITLVLLASATTAGAQPAPLISLHGDSVAAQASTNLRNRLERLGPVRLDATERAIIVDKLPSIRMVGQNDRVVAEVLVLGAGDANDRHGDARMRRDIRNALDALRDVPCVRWLSLKIAGVNGFYQGYVDRADDFNRILATEIVDYPNARIAPYRQWAVANSSAFKADGLHHTAQGRARFAAWVQQVVDRCP
jgi:lysophospholipase L1-like esterase